MKMGPLVLVILDGWGVAPEGKGNAISVAKTPVFDFLKRNYPYTELGAAGKSIGLSKGHQGSSEMGHLIIGAGRSDILPQHRVYNAVKSGEVFENKAYLGALEHAAKNNSTLHLMGLLSDKGVHNYDILEHALIEMAAKNGVKELIVHVFTDGRDTAPFDSKKYVEKLLGVMKENNLGKIGTVMGRYWIMDRDHRWERVEKGYNAIVHGKAEFYEKSAFDAIKNSYTRNKSDEFIMPTVIVDENNESIGKVKNNDAIIWCNFRVDRSIEATRAFIDDDFKAFYRGGKLNVYFV